MTQVTPERWAMWLDKMPMPEGATEEMMWAAFDAIQEMERRDEAIKDLQFFSEMLERDKKRLKESEEWGDIEKAELVKKIIKTTNEIINTLRSRL